MIVAAFPTLPVLFLLREDPMADIAIDIADLAPHGPAAKIYIANIANIANIASSEVQSMLVSLRTAQWFLETGSFSTPPSLSVAGRIW